MVVVVVAVEGWKHVVEVTKQGLWKWLKWELEMSVGHDGGTKGDGEWR